LICKIRDYWLICRDFALVCIMTSTDGLILQWIVKYVQYLHNCCQRLLEFMHSDDLIHLWMFVIVLYAVELLVCCVLHWFLVLWIAFCFVSCISMLLWDPVSFCDQFDIHDELSMDSARLPVAVSMHGKSSREITFENGRILVGESNSILPRLNSDRLSKPRKYVA